jgi:hypothetical protein
MFLKQKQQWLHYHKEAAMSYRACTVFGLSNQVYHENWQTVEGVSVSIDGTCK